VILIVVIGSWLGIIALKLAFDVLRDYLDERPPRDPKPTKNETDDTEREVKRGIAAYRHMKKIEFGLHMMSKREVRIDRPRGAHRRLQVS